MDVEELKGEGNSWLIIDNLMNEVVSGKREGRNGGSDDLYTKHSHPYNISVFFCCAKCVSEKHAKNFP